MKLIFLDIDGVMNNVHRSTILKQDNYRPSGFDPTAVGLLKKLLYSTEAKIIICSTWRLSIGTSIEWWNGLFSAYGIDRYICKNPVIGLTPRLNVERGYEILKFLDDFHGHVESYAILDDSNDYLTDQPLVLVNSDYGLTLGNTEEVKRLLTFKKNDMPVISTDTALRNDFIMRNKKEV